MPLQRTLLLLLLLTISFNSFSQQDSAIKRINDEIRDSRKSSINDGIYIREGFERYKGNIIIRGDSVLYDETILQLYTIRPEYRIIFEKGIFYPGMFIGNRSGEIEEAGTRPDSITAFGNCFTHYNIIGVSVHEEIKMQENTYINKRFSLSRSSCGRANPSEYIIELTNYSATETTDLKTFLENSRVTYIKSGK